MMEEELADCFSAEIVDGIVVSASWKIQESNCETLRAVSVWLADAEARNERDVMVADVFIPKNRGIWLLTERECKENE